MMIYERNAHTHTLTHILFRKPLAKSTPVFAHFTWRLVRPLKCHVSRCLRVCVCVCFVNDYLQSCATMLRSKCSRPSCV